MPSPQSVPSGSNPSVGQAGEDPSQASDGSQTPVEARQGTGPRATVTVLTFSLFIAAVAGSALLAYFVAS